MAKIHGIVYIIIGAAVAAASWMIDFEALKLFFYVGCVFGLIGLFKIVFKGMRDNEDKKIESKEKKGHVPAQSAQRIQYTRNINQQYKRCPRCYNVMAANSNFCSICGTRI